MSLEHDYAQALLGRWNRSVFTTDQYKFTMAHAGFPLRRETFYLSFRRPGKYYIPFDFAAVANTIVRYLNTSEADLLTPAMRAAMHEPLDIWAAPRGSVLFAHEPVLTIAGPSFLVSWLEPLVIAFNYPIQIATSLMRGEIDHHCSFPEEAEIIRLVQEAVQRKSTILTEQPFRKPLIERLKALLDVADPEQLFEVGMRSMTCLSMHLAVLEEVSKVGIDKTSNVLGAQLLNMDPVGTIGHEHQQRWAAAAGRYGNDALGFHAARDILSGAAVPSLLFDTFNSERGLRLAISTARAGTRPVNIRFDNRDLVFDELRTAWSELRTCNHVGFVFEDGMTPDFISRIQDYATSLGIPRSRLYFGVGGYLVNPENFSRNTVQAVYKLSESGGSPTMKGSTPEKRSLPGEPITMRDLGFSHERGIGVVYQRGETPKNGVMTLEEYQSTPGYRWQVSKEGMAFPVPVGRPSLSFRTNAYEHFLLNNEEK